MLKYEDTFVGIIDSVLKPLNIEVLNAARVSYSPIIYWKKIEYLIDIGLEFDELVVFLDISDLHDEVAHYTLLNNKTVGDRVNNLNEGLYSIIHSIIFNNTFVIYHIIKYIMDIGEVNENEIPEMEFPWPYINNSNLRGNWTLMDQNQIEIKEGIRLMRLYMDNLYTLLKENGKSLIAVSVYPWPSQVFYEDLKSIQVSIWKDWCNDHNVNFINNFPDILVETDLSIEQKEKLLSKYYFYGDVHFNKLGNKILAKNFLETYLKK